MKIIVAGSRGFGDYNLLVRVLDEHIEKEKWLDVEIVSGGAVGADKLGEVYARERGYSLKIFPADWKKYGKSAGYLRNQEMAQYGDRVFCFWDGTSRGTGHMIDLARKHGIIPTIIYYLNHETEETRKAD
jgi:hypothetical protein